MTGISEMVADATDEVIGLRQDVANLIVAGEKAIRALIELDGGDPANETGWHDDMARDAWMALTLAIGIARGRN